jgi:predicted enzyme related to lactoylglutathione lyase
MAKVLEFAFVSYPVTDEKRARDFYEGLLNLAPSGPGFRNNEGFWIEYEVGPHTLALSNFWKPEGKSGPCLAFEMDDYDSTFATLKAAGVVFEMETYDSPVCRFCVVKDPDGNQLMIHKRKPGRAS